MKDILMWLVLGTVAFASACTPFLGPPPDGGADRSTGSGADAGGTAGSSDGGGGAGGSAGGATDGPTSPPDVGADGVSTDASDASSTDADANVIACSVDAGSRDCGATSYCAGTMCVAKKADGDVCSSSTECATNTCGGRCCAAGCTCTKPSAGNLLKNPGIDKDTSGWTIDTGTLSRSLSDAEKCPYSGSLVTTVAAGTDQYIVSQCVTNTPLVGDFNFGAQVLIDGFGTARAICQVTFFSGFNCDADVIISNETNDIAKGMGWTASTPESASTVTPVSGANSVRFSCYLAADPSSQMTYYLDMLYVSKAPGTY